MTYESLNCSEKHTINAHASDPIAKTQVEALEKYQLRQFYKGMYLPMEMKEEKKRLRRIIEAQRLIDKLTFCPSI